MRKSQRLLITSFCTFIWMFFVYSAVKIFGEKVSLECERSASNIINCQLTSEKLLAETKTVKIAGESLVGAQLDIYNDQESNLYRIFLISAEHELTPLTLAYTLDEQSKLDNIDKINNFISNYQIKDLKIEQNNRSFLGCFIGLPTLIESIVFFGLLINPILQKYKRKNTYSEWIEYYDRDNANFPDTSNLESEKI